MTFDADVFLAEYAAAYNARDPEKLRSVFALDDDRFSLFEDFTGELFDAELYAATLEAAFDAPGSMSFRLLRSDRFGDVAVVHAIQTIAVGDEEMGVGEAQIRATLIVDVGGSSPRIVSGHFSNLPASGEEGCPPGAGCCGSP